MLEEAKIRVCVREVVKVCDKQNYWDKKLSDKRL